MSLVPSFVEVLDGNRRKWLKNPIVEWDDVTIIWDEDGYIEAIVKPEGPSLEELQKTLKDTWGWEVKHIETLDGYYDTYLNIPGKLHQFDSVSIPPQKIITRHQGEVEFEFFTLPEGTYFHAPEGERNLKKMEMKFIITVEVEDDKLSFGVFRKVIREAINRIPFVKFKAINTTTIPDPYTLRDPDNIPEFYR